MDNYLFLHDGVFKIRTRLTISRPENPKRVISQTLKTLMKFHQCLHCLPRQNRFSEKKYNTALKVLTCDPLIYTLGQPDFIARSFIENSFGAKWISPFRPSVLFVGHKRTVQTQIRHHRTRRLIRVSTLCLHNVLFKC